MDERTSERTMCPEVSTSGGDAKAKSTPMVRRRGLWNDSEAVRHSYGGEGRRPGEVRDVNPLESGYRSGVGYYHSA